MKTLLASLLLVALLLPPETASAQEASAWKQHDMSRPKPPKITPPPPSEPVPPPEGAVVLFDGTDLSAWTSGQGRAAAWKVEDGYFEVVPGAGAIQTREAFGDVQLHIEWASPNPPQHTGQDRGNSGVFLMGRYEVQVLDSYEADTYADGQAGAIYGQYPPRFNAARPPGEWQTYDLFFSRPRFAEDGTLQQPARLTVVHNGILIQDNAEVLGPTEWLRYAPYQAHAEALPISLQDHGSPVRFRNVWALPLPERPAPDAAYATRDDVLSLSAEELDRFVGVYDRPGQEAPITISREGDHLVADFYWRPGVLVLQPVAPNAFVLTETDGRVVFDLDANGTPTRLTFHLGGAEMPAVRAQ